VRVPERDTLFGVLVGVIVLGLLIGIPVGSYAVYEIHDQSIANHQVSLEIKTLLTNGKTASAKAARASAVSSKEAEMIVQQIEKRIDNNRVLLCSVAAALHVHVVPNICPRDP
jgi:hypothetical protein